MNILVFNAGSSSLKFGFYDCLSEPPELIISGGVERIGSEKAEFKVTHPNAPSRVKALEASSIGKAVEIVVQELHDLGGVQKQIDGIGCRIVHGGTNYSKPTLVDAAVLHEIKKLSPLAPLHNPLGIEVMETSQRLFPKVPITAVFDTAFHSTLPKVASTYALPAALTKEWAIRRFGFHGIAHRSVSDQIQKSTLSGLAKERLIVCHLGNGCSVCAILNGQSIDTSMGFTPMEGLVMGTRSGDVDPGLLLYLIETAKLAPTELSKVLNQKSGLLGISELSSDLRDLEKASADGNLQARLAIEIFAFRVAKYVASFAVPLDGVSTIAFSGGIGENSPAMRSLICRQLRFLGIALNDQLNSHPPALPIAGISAAESAVMCCVVHVDEQLQIAKETALVLTKGHNG